MHAATFVLPAGSLKSCATQKFRYSLIKSNGPSEHPTSSCKYSNFLFQSVFLPAVRASPPLTPISILTLPRREKKEQSKFYSRWISGWGEKLPRCSVGRGGGRGVCTRPEIESRNSRWAVVGKFRRCLSRAVRDLRPE